MLGSTDVAVAVNQVIHELVARIPACHGFDVFDSWPLSSNTRDFVAVGVDDLFSTSAADSAEATIDWAHASGRAADEEGRVIIAIHAARGESEAAVARSAVVAQLNAIDDWLRSERHPFGLPSIWSVRIDSYRLGQDQTSDGAICAISARIAYRARI